MYLHVSIPLLLCFSFLLILGTLLPFTDAAANNNNKYNYLMTTAVQPNTDDLPLKNMFGMTVKKHGDTAVVGAFGASLTAPQAGAAYVYRRRRTATDNQEEWVYEATLLAEDGDQKDRFGFAVAVYENIIVVGRCVRACVCVFAFCGGVTVHFFVSSRSRIQSLSYHAFFHTVFLTINRLVHDQVRRMSLSALGKNGVRQPN